MAYEIFISYRRKDTGGYAGRLYQSLVTEFGLSNILFDVEVAGTAEELRNWVKRVVPSCAVVLVLIGEQWFENHEKRRRLSEAGDIVRLEIELAIENQIPIVPIMVDGAQFPRTETLPDSIKKLTDYKGYEISNSHWHSKIQIILDAINFITKSHVPILNRGVDVWNKWRNENPEIKPNLVLAQFQGKDFSHANFEGTDFTGADFSGSNLQYSDFSKANLENANFALANLSAATFNGSQLKFANFNQANLSLCTFENSEIYGVSVWETNFSGANQINMKMTSPAGALVVENIQMAVVYNMLLQGEGIRNIIDSIASKSVLILGRFTTERKKVLDAIRSELRERNYLPMLFDFEKPATRDLTETISILAKLSRFVIADLTDAKGIPQELIHIIPFTPSLPVIPIIVQGQQEYAIFEYWKRYPWVLPVYEYEDEAHLISTLSDGVIEPAEKKVQEIRR